MKKTILAISIVITMLLSCACGESSSAPESKDPTKSSNAIISTGTTESNGSVSQTTGNSAGSSTTSPSVPDVKPLYFNVKGWQDGMFFGYTNDNGSHTYSVLDSKGNVMFDLGEDKRFLADLSGKDTKVFYGDYAVLKDNTIINRKGETVFDLSKTDFDAIYYYECLDVGYVLCSKNINTFEETGTHYFAVKIADGSSYKFEGEMKPMSPGHNYYFGNGIFIYSPANSGFGTKHTFYNILTKEEYKGYKLDEQGEKVYEYLPDLYFFNGFKSDATTKPTVNGHFIAKDDELIIDYDVAAGYCKITAIKDVFGTKDAISDKATSVPYVHKMKYSGEKYGSEKVLINVSTGKFISMNDYSSYDVYAYQQGVGYLAAVTNAGGGKFVTVIKEDGTRAFEPLAARVVNYHNGNMFIIQGENEKYALYNWKGEMLKEWDGKLNRVIMGENSAVVVTMVDSTLSSLLYTKDGKEVNITAMEKLAGINTTQPEGFSSGSYAYSNMLVDENGEAYVLQMN